jgi:hypothetical protein
VSGVLVDEVGLTGFGFALLMVTILSALGVGMYALISGLDSEDWTQVDGRCWVHTTQNLHVFTSDGAVQRHVYCESDR